MAKKCVHKGCGKTYEGEGAADDCLYHPGPPVFHEGQKGERSPDDATTATMNAELTAPHRLEVLQTPCPHL